jgi:hypothetical protein
MAVPTEDASGAAARSELHRPAGTQGTFRR